jgi:hypothetical protein
MSFRLLTTKWRCLRKKLKSSLENSAKMLEACAQLHNYVLDCNIQKEETAMDETDEAKLEIHVTPGSPPLDEDI